MSGENINQFSPKELADWLVTNEVTEAHASLLKDEEVDGKAFLLLEEHDLLAMGLKLGPRKIIMALIKKNKPQPQQPQELDLEVIQELTEQEEDWIWQARGTLQIDPQQTEGESLPQAGTSKGAEPCSSAGLTMGAGPSSSAGPTIGAGPSKGAGPARVGVDLVGFDIGKLLGSHASSKPILKLLEENQSLNASQRRKLVQVLVEELVKTDWYPSRQRKEALAKELVAKYPILRSTPRPGTEGHEHYYSSKSRTGFIEYRLVHIRSVSLTPSKKKYKKRRTPVQPSNEEAGTSRSKLMDEKVTWMRRTPATSATRPEHVEALFDTFTQRREEVNIENLTITAIVERYPRLLDYKGAMIAQEFGMMMPDSKDLAEEYSNFYKPRISALFRERKIALFGMEGVSNGDVETLAMLSALLPSRNTHRKNIMAQSHENCFIVFVAPGVDLESFAKEKGAALSQPHILCVGSPREVGPFYLLLDHSLLPVGPSPLQALQLLIQCHHVFNVRYCVNLQSFINFVEVFLMKLEVDGTAKVVELERQLQHVIW